MIVVGSSLLDQKKRKEGIALDGDVSFGEGSVAHAAPGLSCEFAYI